MRCCCCNALLSDYESTLRNVSTGEFTDMCSNCLSEVPEIKTKGRRDLFPEMEEEDLFDPPFDEASYD